MVRRLFFSVLAIICVSLCQRVAAESPPSDLPASISSNAEMEQAVAALRESHKLVSLAAMYQVDGKIVAAAAVGERAAGSGVPVTLDDQWHLGSITKSMTATMIGRLVESGQMHWDDTVGGAFDGVEGVAAGWRDMSLMHLLTHTAGAPDNFPLAVRLIHPKLGDQCVAARHAAVESMLTSEPLSPPGKNFAYSNVGYTIAGVMAERATGKSWEELMQAEVFEPLGLTQAGFGAPDWRDALSQPRGHLGGFKPKAPVQGIEDNTPIMGPAGTVHMTLAELCTFAHEHLHGQRGEGKLLAKETYQQLHTPALQKYACGWVCEAGDDGLPPHFWHNGSNTMWYANVTVVPKSGAVLAVTSNDGDIKAAEKAAAEIFRRCAGEASAPQP